MSAGSLLTLCALACGCGRLGFDGVPDAEVTPDVILAGHDEDRDGIDDAIDRCPHLPDPAQDDQDGDGVGDLCDPNVAVPTERIVLFETFVAPSERWTFSGSGQQSWDGESLLVDARDADDFAADLDSVPARDVFRYGGHLGQTGTATTRQVTLVGFDASSRYYCELYEVGGTAKVALTYFDGVAYNSIVERPAQAPLMDGDFSLSMSTDGPSIGCTTTWPSPDPDAAAMIPGIIPTHVGMYVQGLEIRYDYFIQIRTE